VNKKWNNIRKMLDDYEKRRLDYWIKASGETPVAAMFHSRFLCFRPVFNSPMYVSMYACNAVIMNGGYNETLFSTDRIVLRRCI
jgi:hypothetical protein